MARLPTRWLLILAALMAVQAGAGLALPSLYRDAQPWVLAAWWGNDAVTLTVAAPGLAWAAMGARRGSTRAGLLALGLLWFNLYNVAYYTFGASLNAAFPLYVALLVLGGAALITSLRALDLEPLAAEFDPGTPVRAVGAVLVAVGGLLTAAWLGQWGAYVLTGRAPAIGLEAVRLIAAMDLSMIAPSMIAGGALLWRRHAWGFVLAPAGAVLGGAYALVLSASTAVGVRRGLPGMAPQLPLWLGLAAVLGAALAVLLRHVGGRARNPAPGARRPRKTFVPHPTSTSPPRAPRARAHLLRPAATSRVIHRGGSSWIVPSASWVWAPRSRSSPSPRSPARSPSRRCTTTRFASRCSRAR